MLDLLKRFVTFNMLMVMILCLLIY